MFKHISKVALAVGCLLALGLSAPQAKAEGFDLFCTTLSCGTASLSGTTWSSSNMTLNGVDADGNNADTFKVTFSADTSTGNGTMSITDLGDADLSETGVVTGFTAVPGGGTSELLTFTVVQWAGTLFTSGNGSTTVSLKTLTSGTVVSADIFGSTPEPSSLLLLGTGLLGLGGAVRRRWMN